MEWNCNLNWHFVGEKTIYELVSGAKRAVYTSIEIPYNIPPQDFYFKNEGKTAPKLPYSCLLFASYDRARLLKESERARGRMKQKVSTRKVVWELL